jgi:hypothetical protein
MAGCLIETTCREDNCSSVMSAELFRDADARAGDFEIDVYERNVRSLAARQLERGAR